jgi:hypothetical protein
MATESEDFQSVCLSYFQMSFARSRGAPQKQQTQNCLQHSKQADTMDNEAKFRREYSKSLAQALEERPKQPPREEVIRETYTALCFDDPQVTGGDHACRLLASCLSKETSPYNLSDALMDGILQATNRTTVVPVKTEEQEENEEELVWHTEGLATASGYALLAFTCLVKIPLQCCHSSDINTVTRLLGSYRGPKQDTRQPQQQQDCVEADLNQANEDDARIKALSEGISGMAAATNDSSDKGSSDGEHEHEYEEVWAAESDPSDYEYESGAQTLDFHHWQETAFDPEAISKPPPSSDWNDLSRAVVNLLSCLSYSKLAPLSQQQWHMLNVSDQLSQLTLTLLIQPENSSTLVFQNADLQQLGIRPLYVLRDRVAAYPETLGDYITLVQTLIAVDAAEPTKTREICAATIVGLSALSAQCTCTCDSKQTAQRLQRSVLDTSEDLTHIVEKSRRNDESSAVQVMWTLLPLLDRLTNITSQGTILEASCAPLSTANAQLLLQTGLFRELILLYTDTSKENENDVSRQTARVHLLRSLQAMCIQSVSLLGKYAWRVPDLARIVQSDEFAEQHVVDGMIWNLLGSTLAGGPVRLKIKGVPVVTATECCIRVMTGLERLCSNTETAMSKIRLLRTSTSNVFNDDNGWKESIQDLSRFTTYLVSCPSFATLWREVITANNGSLQKVNATLDSLRTVLSELPRIPEPPKPTGTNAKKTSDNDKAGDPIDRPASTYGENEVAAVRKAIKILAGYNRGDAPGGSSKTD